MEDPIIFDGMIRAGNHVFLVDWYPDGVPRLKFDFGDRPLSMRRPPNLVIRTKVVRILSYPILMVLRSYHNAISAMYLELATPYFASYRKQ